MQALVYTANNLVEVLSYPTPEPASGEALLRVEAAGICGSDVDGFLGHSRKRRPPLVMGHEFVGRLVEPNSRLGLGSGELVAVMPLIGCGECRWCEAGKSNLCPARKLIGMDLPGAFADYVSVPEHLLYPLGDKMSVASAILAEPTANACHVARLLKGEIPECPVIIGFGTIGTVVALVLKHHGCGKFVAIDTNPAKLELARSLGAVAAIDGREPDVASRVAEAAGTVDLVIDCIGKGVSRALGIGISDPSARLIWIGQNDGEMAGEARDITTKELCIQGSYGYTVLDFEAALGILAEHDGAFRSLVTFEKLGDGQSAFERLVSDPGALVKVALVPDASGAGVAV